MRIFFLITCIILSPAILLAQKNSISVEGTWKNGPESVWLLSLDDAAMYKLDRFHSAIDPVTGKFSFLILADHPILLQLANKFFLTLPGDTVLADISGTLKEAKIVFHGSKAHDHGFFESLKSANGNFKVYEYDFDQPSSIQDYKKAAATHFKSVLNFYEKYYGQSPESAPEKLKLPAETTSPRSPNYSQNLTKALLSISYYNDLLYPVVSRKVAQDKLPADYFSDIDTALLSKKELLPFRQYILLLADFNTAVYAQVAPKGKNYDSAFAAGQILAIRKNYKTDVKNDLLLFLYRGLAEHGKENNTAQIRDLYDSLTMAFKDDPVRITKIRELRDDFETVNKIFPESVRHQLAKTSDGKFISVADIFPPGKIVYVDFWASWCGPCVAEMPAERELIASLKEKGIEFALISVDSEENKWKAAMSRIQVDAHHYLIQEEFHSQLANYLALRSIPRYLIIGKNGNLLNRDAPRPSLLVKDQEVLLSAGR